MANTLNVGQSAIISVASLVLLFTVSASDAQTGPVTGPGIGKATQRPPDCHGTCGDFLKQCLEKSWDRYKCTDLTGQCLTRCKAQGKASRSADVDGKATDRESAKKRAP